MRMPAVLRFCLLGLAVIATPARVARGEQWISPDGVVAIAAPDAAEFVLMDDPPSPFLALWVSKDDTVFLGVTKAEVAAGVVLDQATLEQELAAESKGAITSSATVVSNGQTLWVITTESSAHGKIMRITQAITQIGIFAYKAYAATVGERPEAEAWLDGFVETFEIQNPGPAIAPEPDPAAEPAGGVGVDLHALSKSVGGAALLLLMGLAAWWFLGRSAGKNERPSNSANSSDEKAE